MMATGNSLAPTPRIAWIDACKGIGIATVVLGHTSNGTMLQRFIYVFHMPLFFFLSGYLYTIEPNVPRYWKKKSIHLLLPYVAFLLLFFSWECVHVFRYGGSYVQLAAKFLWGGDRLRGPFGIFWFFTCLFLTQQHMNLLLTKLKPRIVAAVVAILMAMSYANSIYFPGFALPLDAHVVFAASPFFFAGYAYRQTDCEAPWFYLISFGAVGFAFFLLRHKVPISFDMRGGVYGVPILSAIISLGCIISVIAVSRLICHTPLVGRVFGALGMFSMGIMVIHKLLFLPRQAERMVAPGSLGAALLILTTSYVATYMLHRASITRALFLGSERDLLALLNRSQ